MFHLEFAQMIGGRVVRPDDRQMLVLINRRRLSVSSHRDRVRAALAERGQV
jgi:hypothetical protein